MASKSTPEGKVKAAVKRVLAKYETTTWYDMPVPSGFGKSTLDFIGFNLGRGFVIETKAEGKKPTKLQQNQLDEIARKGGKVFVICGIESPVLADLQEWLG